MPIREKTVSLPKTVIAKRFMLIFLPLAIALFMVAMPMLQSLEISRRAAISNREQGYLSTAEYLIRKEFFENFADIGILANLPSLIDYIEQPNADNLAKVDQAFVTFAEQYRRYDQVRYLDVNGREIIRINYKDDHATITPPERLQNKFDRPYFREANRLAAGERYVSAMDLNVEHGRVEQPYKPMIRFGMPVFGHAGQRYGVVVLNYLGNQFRQYFDNLMPESSRGHSMLLNKDGYWLIAEQPEDEWGFMFGREQANFAYRYPQVWQTMSRRQDGQVETEEGLFIFKTVYPARDAQLPPYLQAGTEAGAGNAPYRDYEWKILRFIPKQALYADSFINTVSGRVWTALLFTLLALIAWNWAYFSTRNRKERNFSCMILDSLPAHIGVLNSAGRLVLLNKAWEDFAQANSMADANAGLGSNYLTVTQNAKGLNADEAPDVSEGLQAMLDGRRSAFAIEYPCHAPDKQRWFQMQARSFRLGRQTMIVVAHMDITARKTAEIKLNREIAATQRANRTLAVTQMALDKTEIGEFWIAADSGRIVRVNDHACAYLGYTREELLNLTIPDIAPEYNLDVFRSHAGKIREQGWERFEATHQAKDGRIIPVELNLMYAFAEDKDGQNGLLIAFAADITERKRAEAKLINTINKNKLLLNTLNEQLLYSVADLNGRISDVNDYFCHITGYSREEIIGKSHRIFGSGVHDDAFWEEMWKTIKSGKAWRGDICNRARDGSLFWVDTVIAPFINAAGQIESYVSLRADITDKKRTAQALEKASQAAQEQVHLLQALNQAETWYRFVIESSDDAIIGKDLDGTIKIWNPGAEKIFGYSAEEAIGRSTRMLIPADKMNEDYDFMRLIQRGESIHHYETQRLHKNGNLIEVSVSLAPILDVNGDSIGASKIVRDITEHKQLEKTLLSAKRSAEAANQAKSVFLSTMSHEIRTPLNAIIGMAYLLEGTSLSDDQKEQVDAIQISSRNLLALINDILDLSKIEAGELSLENYPLSLQDLVNELRTMFTVLAEPKGLVLDMPLLSPELPAMVEGDETRLRQMLINLVNNAIKFTERGTVALRIELLSRDDAAQSVTLRFTVRDSGIGISSEAQSKLFKPFTQVDPSTTRKFGGTGLGLSIVRQLAEQMGGRVGVDSVLGRGSAFWFELPMKVSSATAPQLDYVAVRPLHVLIAEDDKSQRQALTAMASRFGWIVEAVDNGQAVIDRVMEKEVQGYSFDCIILDWRMPQMNGLEALAMLKTKVDVDRIPAVIMATAYDQDSLRKAADSIVPDSILTKPVDSSVLFSAVNKAVTGHGLDYDHVLNSSLIKGEHHRWLPGIRLLVVDDSPMNLNVCQRILENEGALVTLSESGEDALTKIRSDPQAFDAVLMDIQMPIMDGCEATRRIRKELALPDLPVIALTAGAMSSEREHAMEAGMDDFLTKPLDPPRLVRVLRKHIENRQAKPLPIEPKIIRNEEQIGWPEITGINSQRAKSNMEGDFEFFEEVLRMFVDEHANTLPILETFLERGDKKGAADLAHRLKGSAGNIGAMELVQHAAALETGLRENAADTEHLLADLRLAHRNLIGAASAWLSERHAAKRQSAAISDHDCDRQQLQTLLPDLERLLSGNQFEANKLSKDIESLLANTRQSESYHKVAERIANLQYKEALVALHDFQTNLSIELQ